MRGLERKYWNAELETMAPDDLRAWQLPRLQHHVAYAYGRSPLYRRLYDEAGVRPDQIKSLEDIRRLPFTSKSLFIEDQHKNPPFGDWLAVDPKELIRMYWAPGPETICLTPGDLEHLLDLGARTFFTNGVRSDDIVNVTCTYNWVIAGTLQDEAYRRIGATVIPGGAGMTQMHVEVMKLTQATAMFVFPTFAEEIAKQAREMGLDPSKDLKLRLACISGEIRSEAMRRGLEEAFGMQTRELYGTAEVPFVAAECPCGGGMHLDPRFITEVLDPVTLEPVPPGSKGELVVTDVTKRAQPTIRYRTGDITSGFDFEPCPCGRTTPRMGRILGRSSEIPRVKGLFIVPKEVAEVLTQHEELGRFQLVVDRPGTRDTMTVRVECAEEQWSDRFRGTLIQELKDKIRITAEIEFVPSGGIAADAKVVVDKRIV